MASRRISTLWTLHEQRRSRNLAALLVESPQGRYSTRRHEERAPDLPGNLHGESGQPVALRR